MKFSNEPIINIDQAKQFFLSMDCSRFHMRRKNPARAKEYNALQIAVSIESEWIRYDFDRKLEKFQTILPGDYGNFLKSLFSLIDRNETHLVKLYELIRKMQVKLLPDQIEYILSTIIGNNATKTKGGLIQMSFDLGCEDLAYRFYSLAKGLIIIAEENVLTLPFTRGNLIDLINYYNIEEDEGFLIRLLQKDNAENFNYFRKAAEQGDIYGMRMLSNYYRDGKGCEQNFDLALYWIKRAKNQECS